MYDNVDAQIDAVIYKIAQELGVPTDRVAPIVDQYGAEYCEAALEMYRDERAQGFTPQAPMGYLISLLRKGVVQQRVEGQRRESAEAAKDADWMYERYHRILWLRQEPGIAGPGSCHCCPDGGKYAGKPLEEDR